jgi:hypothetical protein
MSTGPARLGIARAATTAFFGGRASVLWCFPPQVVKVVEAHAPAWKTWYNAAEPEKCPAPGFELALGSWKMLLFIRCIRVDRTLVTPPARPPRVPDRPLRALPSSFGVAVARRCARARRE